MAVPPRQPAPDPDVVADAIVAANRVLLQASAGALREAAPELNLSHLRVLTILDRGGPQRLIDVADALDVTATTATRLADRIAERGMVERVRQSDDRREIHLAISAAGHDLVATVSLRRRELVASRLLDLGVADQVAAVELLARIAGSPRYPNAATA